MVGNRKSQETLFGNMYKAKPILRSLYFYFFSIFRSCIFILRHCILVLLFSYRFRPSVRTRCNYLDVVKYTIDYVYFKNKKYYKKIKYIYLNATYIN